MLKRVLSGGWCILELKKVEVMESGLCRMKQTLPFKKACAGLNNAEWSPWKQWMTPERIHLLLPLVWVVQGQFKWPFFREACSDSPKQTWVPTACVCPLLIMDGSFWLIMCTCNPPPTEYERLEGAPARPPLPYTCPPVPSTVLGAKWELRKSLLV